MTGANQGIGLQIEKDLAARALTVLAGSRSLERGEWALRTAIGDYLRWNIAGVKNVSVAVNVSPVQLRNRGFIDEIRRAVDVDPRAASGLELEITESLLMEDVNRGAEILQAIRLMGVRIAIDDFGTGFSSLSGHALCAPLRIPFDSKKRGKMPVSASLGRVGVYELLSGTAEVKPMVCSRGRCQASEKNHSAERSSPHG